MTASVGPMHSPAAAGFPRTAALLLLLATSPAGIQAAESAVIEIDSLAALAKYAGQNDVHVRMKPGTYVLDDPGFARAAEVNTPDAEGRIAATYRVNTLLHFSGRDSVFDLMGVVIHHDTKLHQAVRSPLDKIFVSGDRLTIRGLSFIDQGATPAGRGGLRMLHVIGNGNRIENVTLHARGSSPYGYGNLLGKGGNALVPLYKQSCLLITGRDTRIIGARVIARVFGHGIVMQGAVNTWIERCYVEGEMRLTDEILKETSGPAHSIGFKSDYPPGHIVPGLMIALSEDGIRAYPNGSQVGRRTTNITVVDCTVQHMRSGFDLSAASGDVRVTGSTALGCNEKGFNVPSRGVIRDCAGDAKYGPLLALHDKGSRDCQVDLLLLASNSDHPPARLAEINGSGHRIVIRSHAASPPIPLPPIAFGDSFWADVHHFRAPDTKLHDWTGARGIELHNDTLAPVTFSPTVRDCVVFTRGEVLQNAGTNIQIRKRTGTTPLPR